MGNNLFSVGLLFLTIIIIIARGELSIKYCIATRDSNCTNFTITNNPNCVQSWGSDRVACYDPDPKMAVLGVICIDTIDLASQVPKYAVIVIMEKASPESRTFICTASSFVLFPTTLQFIVTFEDGRKEILSPDKKPTWWTLGHRNVDNCTNVVNQEIHFSQLPDDVTSITCFAMARNSSKEIFADKFNTPTGCSNKGVMWQVAGSLIASQFLLAGIILAVVYLRRRWVINYQYSILCHWCV